MKQLVKYGLTTSLRAFELPEIWDGEQTVVISAEGISVGADTKNSQAISVPAGFKGTITIRRNITGNRDNTMQILVKQDSEARIIEEITGSGTYKANVLVTAEPGCSVKYFLLQAMEEDSVCLLNYEGTGEKGSFIWNSCFLGGDTTRAVLETRAGDEYDSQNYAVVLGSGNQQFDIHVSTKHAGKHSRSNMLTKSVLDDKSRAVYHGLINISQDAAKIDSYQKDEVILLSDGSSADAIPNLEIHNNDVSCTHGASIGKLDEEKLFYLKSRGIAEADAKRIITEGFVEPLVLPAWQHLIREKISRS